MLANKLQKIEVILAQSYGFESIRTNGNAIRLQSSTQFYFYNHFVPEHQRQNQLFAIGKIFGQVRIRISLFFRAKF